jgi:hypothetical protein
MCFQTNRLPFCQMKKPALIVALLIFLSHPGICQLKNPKDDIKETVVNFLNWYKTEQHDKAQSHYSFIKGGYPDTTTKQAVDWMGVERYLNHLRETGYFSETYLNDLGYFFKKIDDNLKTRPKTKDLVKIDGLDRDWILKTFEPEAILDQIEAGRFNKISVIYNKAMVRFRISKSVQLLFTLTRTTNKWQIDSVGYDASYKYSAARQ